MSNNKSLVVDDNTKQIVKKKRNRPDLDKFGEEYIEPGDNSRYLRHALVSWDLPVIDISDEKQVEQRIKDYFSYCIENDRKPNMVGMANWIGIDRTTLTSWKNGEYRTQTHSPLIKKAVNLLEELWTDYMQNGKINPTSGIFIAKNMFQYQDNITITPGQPNPMGEQQDPATIAAKYAELPED